MRRPPPRSTRTDTRFPYTTLCRSDARLVARGGLLVDHQRERHDPREQRDETALHRAVGARHAGGQRQPNRPVDARHRERSEEHTSELQSLMRTSYAVFCLKKNKTRLKNKHKTQPKHTVTKHR